MNRNFDNPRERGFTMVELLVVLAIFGIAMVGIYGVHLSTQRSAYTQEKVVDLQQNLRVALESIGRDLRWAGFLVRGIDTPIATAGEHGLTLNTISGSRKVAQIASAFDSTASSADVQTITLREPIELDSGKLVRIVRPSSAAQPVPHVLTLTADSSSTTLKLSGFTVAHPFAAGDIVAEYIGTNLTDQTPNTITYSLVGNDLIREDGSVGGGDKIVASGITVLTFSYLMDSGGEQVSVASGDLDEIRAVKIELQAAANTASGSKTRGMTSTVALRNRK